MEAKLVKTDQCMNKALVLPVVSGLNECTRCDPKMNFATNETTSFAGAHRHVYRCLTAAVCAGRSFCCAGFCGGEAFLLDAPLPPADGPRLEPHSDHPHDQLLEYRRAQEL